MSTGTLELPWALLGMSFGLDRTTGVFLALTLLLWGLAAVHAAGYLARDPRRGRFMAFFLATFAGNVGLVLARDGAGFYLFFAVMTFAAYGLVVHSGEPAALRAGRVYIALAVLGEALLLGGLMLAAAGAQSLAIADLRAAVAASPQRDVAVALLFAGFGVKAGALGLHVWLPLAHPVAPTPASAVLSGAMIKAGLLGWLHFLPLGEGALPQAGLVIVAAGLGAAFYAAIVGVMQDDAKTVLAYSSVGQMGFMTVAVGAALAEPHAAPAAIAAVVFFALHHGLAKGALFLGVGIAPRGRRAAHMAVLALPALVLAGMPLTSGAVAKYALKHGLEGLAWAHTVALALSLGAVGTTLLMARFLYLAHAGGQHHHTTRSRRALVAWLACVAASLAVVMLPSHAPDLPAASAVAWRDGWPLAVGAVLSVLFAWGAGPLRHLRVRAGDVLWPSMALVARGTRRAQALGERIASAAMGAFAHLEARWHAFVERLDGAWAGGETWLRGAGPAVALLLVVAAFFLAA